MKPIVYFDFKECNDDKNSIIVAKDRLKEILNEVYQAGYEDGIKNKTTITTTPWNWRDNIYCGNEQIVPREITSATTIKTGDTVVACENK